jgi:hypothetical protein
MRNLRQVHQFLIGADSIGPDVSLLASSWDVGTNSIICAYTISNDTLLRLARISVMNSAYY